MFLLGSFAKSVSLEFEAY